MIIPAHYDAIMDDIVNRITKYGEKGRIPVSIIIKGDIYSGVEQLHAEIYRKTEQSCSKYFNIKKVKLHLTEGNLSNEILKELNSIEKNAKKGTIFFLEGIDRLLNIPGKKAKKGSTMGRSANVADTIQEAHKLRKILLENTNKVSIVSSSSLSASFMEDPELPFYKFFNEITLTPLSAVESDKCFSNLLKKNQLFDGKNPTMVELGNYAYDWAYKLTGGNWLLLQKFDQVLSAFSDTKNNIKTKSFAKEVLEEYFTQIMPIIFMELENLSREEKKFIENAFFLGIRFNTREMYSEINNTSLMAQRLVQKGMLLKNGTQAGSYIFKHIPLRTLLRYYSKYELTDVFSENSLNDRSLKG